MSKELELQDFTYKSDIDDTLIAKSSLLNDFDFTESLKFDQSYEGVEGLNVLFGGFQIKKKKYTDDATGIWAGIDSDRVAKMYLGDATNNMKWTGTALELTGSVTASAIIITGGSISGTSIASIPNSVSTDISLLEKSHDLVFSVTDADTIAWATGTIVMSNGRTFAIDAGNTGNMAALTYIYLDTGTSLTVLQTTTTYSTAMGANKVLLGMAQNNTVTASFIPYGAGQPLIDGANIGALSIVAGNIAASTITAGKMNVSQLSAIAADIGTITAGSISVVNGGNTIGLTPAGTNAIFSGTTGSPEFLVTPAGALTATSATVKGNITVDSLSFTKFTLQSYFESLSGWTTSANIFNYLGYCELYTTATLNNRQDAYVPTDDQFGIAPDITKNPVIEIMGASTGNGTRNAYIGLGDETGDEFIGFKLTKTEVYAQWFDTNPTAFTQILSGISPDVVHVYRCEITNNTDVKFYVDGTLEYTASWPGDGLGSPVSIVNLAVKTTENLEVAKLHAYRVYYQQDT